MRVLANRSVLVALLLAAIVALVGCGAGRTAPAIDIKPFDIVIAGGTILDGNGGEPYTGDVGIRGDRIIAIGEIDSEQAITVIDADGKYVMPGIIDAHSHADRELLEMPDAPNLLQQGITTLVTGNCGGSEFPVGEFFSDLENEGISLNIAHLIGHNTIRRNVMGLEARDATPAELEEMSALVAEGMKEGAVGISTGLKYTPGTWATTDEVVELSKVAAEYGGIYTSHMRDEGRGIIESVEETITIGRRAGIPVQISHHKIASTDRYGDSVKTLALVDKARGEGIDVFLDQYPYTATSTGLTVIFPPWCLEGGQEALVERLADTELRSKIAAGIVDNIIHDRGGGDPANLQIARCESRPDVEGKNFAEVLRELDREVTPEEAAELAMEIQSEGGAGMIYHCLDEGDLQRIMRHPYNMIATDSHICALDEGMPHPRNYGTFPRVFKVYVKEKKILTFPEAVRKMTSLPADVFMLERRGRLAAGNFADIVVFDPDEIADSSTWDDPHQYPVGIDAVLVNGRIEIRNGKQFDVRAGQVLRRAQTKRVK